MAVCIAVTLLLGVAISLDAFTAIDDDATISLLVDLPFPTMLKPYLHASFDHLPLFEACHWVWIRVVGNSVAARRLHSVLYLAISLAIVWPMLVRCFGSRLAIMAFGAIAASPYLFLMSHTTGWYMQFHVFLMGSLSLFTLLLAGDRRRWVSWGFMLVNIGLVYTCYFGWVFLALYTAYAAYNPIARPILRHLIWLHLGVALAFLPWLPQFFQSASRYPLAFGNLFTAAHEIPYSLFVLTVGESVPLSPYFLALTAAVLLGLGILCIQVRRQLPPFWFLFGILFAGGLLMGGSFGVMESGARRAILLSGLYGILLGSLLGIAVKVRPRLTLILSVGLLGCWTVSYANLVSGRDFIAYRWVEPWPAIAHSLAQELRPEDVVVCYHPSLEFYLRQEKAGISVYSPTEPSTRKVVEKSQGRVWYFQTTMSKSPDQYAALISLEVFLKTHHRILGEQSLLWDPWVSVKQAIFPKHYYPNVRIRVLVYEVPASVPKG